MNKGKSVLLEQEDQSEKSNPSKEPQLNQTAEIPNSQQASVVEEPSQEPLSVDQNLSLFIDLNEALLLGQPEALSVAVQDTEATPPASGKELTVVLDPDLLEDKEGDFEELVEEEIIPPEPRSKKSKKDRRKKGLNAGSSQSAQ